MNIMFLFFSSIIYLILTTLFYRATFHPRWSQSKGIWKISLEWLNQTLISEKEIIYAPYSFRKARELAASVFSDNSEENFRMYDFESIDRIGKSICLDATQIASSLWLSI